MLDSHNGHAMLSQAIAVAGLDFTFSLELADPAGSLPALTVELSAEPLAALPDTYLIRFVAERADGEDFRVRRFSLRWRLPAVDMHGFYASPPSPDEMIKLPYWWVKKQACANSSFPFVTLFHRSGENRAAFGLIDQLTETALDADLVEATRSYHFHWHKPRGEMPLTTGTVPVLRWEEALFVSTARCAWPEVLKAYVAVVDQEWPQPKMAVPPSAYDPVFCTWTAVHHAVSQDWVLRNARLASELGFGSWLTDDGWFTDKADFANYSYAGDWEPCLPKFPDFAGHVRAVQAMGLRYILWVAPFMVGTQSAAAQRYAHLLMPGSPRLNFSNLSPQLRQTGAVVVDLLGRLMRDYGLDGLKIDFIDDIQPNGHHNGAADFATLGEGFYTIMSEAADRLRELKPDALIEYRNSYTNLASRRFANLYRASDVPLNFTMNRWQVVMLRLLAPDRAVHLDPGLWHPADSDEAVAVHLINLISSVPMVSIELDRYPQSHLDLIRHWIGFYRAHRDTIVHGVFAPEIRHGHIPHIRHTGSSERILGVYDDCAFALQRGPLPLWILNASTRPYVELLPDDFAGTHNVSAYDKFGRRLSAELLTFPRPRLEVEVGGSLEIAAG